MANLFCMILSLSWPNMGKVYLGGEKEPGKGGFRRQVGDGHRILNAREVVPMEIGEPEADYDKESNLAKVLIQGVDPEKEYTFEEVRKAFCNIIEG